MSKNTSNPHFWSKEKLVKFLNDNNVPATDSPINLRKLAYLIKQTKQTNKMAHTSLFGKPKSTENLDQIKTDNITKSPNGKGGSHFTPIDQQSIDEKFATLVGRIANLETRNRDTAHSPMNTNSLISIITQVPTFNGHHSQDVGEFFEKLDRIGNLGHWSDLDKLQVLGLKVEGQARTYWETLLGTNQQITYQTAKEKMLTRFSRQMTPSDLLQQFTNMQLKTGESIDSLADRVNAIHTRLLHTSGNNIVETLTKVLEQLTIDSFLRALPDKIGRHVRVLFPKTLDDARRLASALFDMDSVCLEKPIFHAKEENSDSSDEDIVDSRVHNSPPMSPKTASRTLGRSPKPRRKNEPHTQNTRAPPHACKFCGSAHWHSDCPVRKNYSPSNSRSSSPNTSPRLGRKVRCFSCEGMGHMSRDCPSRKVSTRVRESAQPICQFCDKPGHSARKCHMLAKIFSKN